jgi:glycosyltransferase involved in cell wall biosynthesis
MKIGILVSHPTQFEGPFYRYASLDHIHSLRVIFCQTAYSESVFDPELGKSIKWGIDILTGYDHVTMPERGRVSWLVRELKRNKFDLLIINGYNRLILLVAAFIARLVGTKIALRLDTVWDSQQARYRRMYKSVFYPLLFRVYDRFFVTSGLTRDYLVNRMGVPSKSVFNFTYAVDQEWFRAASVLSTDQKNRMKAALGLLIHCKVVISVSKFIDREMPWDLLRAVAELGRDDVACLLVGDGPGKRALENFSLKNPQARILFGGYVPYSELPKYYAVSDVFVHAAAWEPYGVSVAEAMVTGLPVIASNKVGSAHDLIEPGINGFIYESGNVKDLTEKLTKALAGFDPDAHAEATDRSLRLWSYQATWKEILNCAESVNEIRRDV